MNKLLNKVVIEGVEYYRPECHCEPGMGHICYLRPVPQTINVPIEKIIAATNKAKGNQNYEPKH